MPLSRNPLNKPEKKDFKQEFLETIANQSGPLAAITMEQALKHQNTQIEEAMTQGGMALPDITQVIAQQFHAPEANKTEGKKGNFWFTPFQMNKKTGEVTPASMLGGLISQNPKDVLAMAQAQRTGRINAEQQQALDPEEAALKIKEANEALTNQGLEGYEAKLTATGGITASKPSSYTTATSKENIQGTVNGIADGSLPPDLTKIASRRDLTNVAGMLAKKGLDLRQLTLDYQAEQAFIKGINSTQQLRLRQLIPSVINGIDDLQKLNKDFKRTGIKGFNKGTVEFYANGGGSKEQQQIAQKFVSQMTVLSDEMGSIFMGGNTPTERSLDLAMKLFNSNYNDTAVDSSMEQVKRNLGYRANAIESVQAVGTKGVIGEGTISGGKNKEQPKSSFKVIRVRQ